MKYRIVETLCPTGEPMLQVEAGFGNIWCKASCFTSAEMKEAEMYVKHLQSLDNPKVLKEYE